MRVPVIACMVSFAFLLAVPSAMAQADTLIGVWKLTELQSPVSAMNTTNPQPWITIFTQKHFSTIGVSGEKPRPDMPKDPTKEQLIEFFRTFGSVAGTYKVEDATLTMHVIVSWIPNYMNEQKTDVRTFRFEGDNLVLIQAPPENPAIQTIWKYTRIE